MGNNQSNNGFPLTTVIIIASIVVALIIIGVILFIILKNKKPKAAKIKVDEEFMTNLISSYGGAKNILKCEVDNGRLKVTVEDLDAVSLPNLKQQSQAGVFVTGNVIKTLYKFDSKLIKSLIDKQI